MDGLRPWRWHSSGTLCGCQVLDAMADRQNSGPRFCYLSLLPHAKNNDTLLEKIKAMVVKTEDIEL
jgi:hypothetical protein